ncbi:acyl-coenzyme A synthetase/AMP-(fatty) acid ligase/thioesterase domain-containing protein [Rhodococcus sp. 27YEA15]|uniref:alpha/beta fold hydrolase n=1 Tax=Rhodococcus sp. 27YEA15 TaxID=3156259 RepID=UPI003C7CFE5C
MSYAPLSLDSLDTTVADRIRTVAAEFGDRIALSTPEADLTYEQLDAASALWESRFRAGPEGAIAFVVDLSSDSLTAVVGAIRSRRPVVMIDPQLPDPRVAHIRRTLPFAGAVSDRKYHDRALTVCEHVVFTDTRPTDATHDRPPAESHSAVVSYQFTSGSTGEPKCVKHTNDMWLCDALLLQDGFGFGPQRRVGSTMPISFGAGMNVLLAGLMTGSRILAYDPRQDEVCALLPWMNASGVEIVVMTPSLLRGLAARTTTALPRLTRLITTGEPVHGKDARAGREAFAPEATFTNWVGSSETGGLAYRDYSPAEPFPDTLLPAGVVAPGKSVAFGQDGTVRVRSAYLCGGYLDEATTAAAFENHADGTRTFVTGDRGRWDESDGLVLLGRRDGALKIRGYLVETTEIVAALLRSPDIAEAYVLVTGPQTPSPVLTAFVVPDHQARTPAPAQLRQRLVDTLPAWMIPTSVVVVDHLPRTERGKVDPSALAPPERGPIEPPHPGTESEIAEIWCQALTLDAVGRNENFHELGGDSLAVQDVLARITRLRGITLTTADVAACPSLAAFADRVDRAGRTGRRRIGSGTATTTVPLRVPENSTREPFWCFTGAGASALTFLPLTSHLPADQPVYAFQPFGLEERGLPDWTVARAARRHLRDIDRISPDGPHVLIGHSLGGLIAVEVARRLAEQGRQVKLLVLLDTFLPPAVTKGTRTPEHTPPVVAAEEPLTRAELWKRRLALPLAGIVQRDPVAQTGAMEEVGRRVALLHRPKPWAGDAVVYQSAVNGDDPDLWHRIIQGELTIRRVDCDHASIVRAPHIGRIAAELSGALMRND